MSKPKIVVLHMRELIYTAIFIFLILVLLILLFLMFRPHDASNTPDTETKQRFLLPLMQIPSDISPESIRLP